MPDMKQFKPAQPEGEDIFAREERMEELCLKKAEEGDFLAAIAYTLRQIEYSLGSISCRLEDATVVVAPK